MNRSYYAIIPANVRYDKELKANAKLLYGEITALCNEKGYCWASNKYFADLYGVSKVSISKWINQLIDKGYIYASMKYKDGTREIEERHIFIGQLPIKEKFKDNNTYINNTINNSKYIDKENSSNKLKEFSRLYEQNIGLINGITAEYLIDLSENIDINLFKRAIEIATDRGKCSLGYIKGIIKQWLDCNIKTLEQLEAYKLQQEQSKRGVKSDVRGREGIIKTEISKDDGKSEAARREELLRQIRELDN